MKTNHLLRLFPFFAAVIALACLPVPSFAQRGGGHGGGGGFHGGGGASFHGGGGASFHGGSVSSYGGGHYYGGGAYHGGYGGYHGGGYYGWRGRYWGYPGYGYGWGWGWGLGFGWPYSYGWGYPYGYGYSPYYYYAPYPYYDPNYCPPGYTCTYNGNGDPPPAPNAAPNNGHDPASPGGASSANPSGYAGAYESNAPILSVDHINATPSNYQTVQPAVLKNRSLTPRVENAMRSLREMPPFAREREIETGRYSQFSPQEKKLLRNMN
jgi:hypothetical protein